MDNQVRKFLLGEKATSTDRSHKCVATKFGKWLLERSLAKDPEKKVSLSRSQQKAIRE